MPTIGRKTQSVYLRKSLSGAMRLFVIGRPGIDVADARTFADTVRGASGGQWMSKSDEVCLCYQVDLQDQNSPTSRYHDTCGYDPPDLLKGRRKTSKALVISHSIKINFAQPCSTKSLWPKGLPHCFSTVAVLEIYK